jgi:hypothetical protein
MKTYTLTMMSNKGNFSLRKTSASLNALKACALRRLILLQDELNSFGCVLADIRQGESWRDVVWAAVLNSRGISRDVTAESLSDI